MSERKSLGSRLEIALNHIVRNHCPSKGLFAREWLTAELVAASIHLLVEEWEFEEAARASKEKQG